MLNVKSFQVNPLQENCYVVSDDSKECVIIDCGAYYDAECQAIDNYLRDNQLSPVHLLATHGHLDHNFGNAHLFEKYALKVEICAEDQSLVEHLPEQASTLFGMQISDDQPPIGKLLSNGDHITVMQGKPFRLGCFYNTVYDDLRQIISLTDDGAANAAGDRTYSTFHFLTFPS